MSYTREFVNQIRDEWNYSANVTTSELAAKYGLKTDAIRRIVMNELARHYDRSYIPRPIPKIANHKKEVLDLYRAGKSYREIADFITHKYKEKLSYNTCYVMINRKKGGK